MIYLFYLGHPVGQGLAECDLRSRKAILADLEGEIDAKSLTLNQVHTTGVEDVQPKGAKSKHGGRYCYRCYRRE